MAEVASLTSEPVTLIEVGCSAGAHLRFDEYRYELRRPYVGKGVLTRCRVDGWRDGDPPGLALFRSSGDRVGIDLNPIDATDPDERLWLRALIWPENTAQAALQDEALRVVAADPPRDQG